MENEKQFGKGAIIDKPDNRDILYSKVAMGSTPFDWSTGYDIETVLGTALGNQAFKISSKDQNGSGSCGGQAWSYAGAVLEGLVTGTYEERSAKFIYSQTYVLPAGSDGRTNCELVKNQGWAREAVCASYDGGNPPSEVFMQRKSDITPEAKNDANKAKALVYGNVTVSIDAVAKAIRDEGGVILGITGKNNGTWLSSFPKPPDKIDRDCWNHWVYCGKAKMINGKKYIGLKNSWGNIGESGWQWIGEEYFVKTYIWSVWTLIFKPVDQAWHHTFTVTLKKGSSGLEVEALQKALTLEGMFKGVIDGKFGPITKAAVEVFQARYSLWVDGVVGPKTNRKLNSLYEN